MLPKPCTTRLFTLLVLLCTAHLSPAAIHRPAYRVAVEQIEKLEGDWRDAQLAGDIAAMDRLLSDDFLGITAAGTVITKAQQLDRMRSRQFALKKLAVEDTKIKLIGTIAIVTSLAAVDGTVEGGPVKGSFRYTRVYQRLPGGSWKITSYEATRVPQSQILATAQTLR